jgi:hypothetical protein
MQAERVIPFSRVRAEVSSWQRCLKNLCGRSVLAVAGCRLRLDGGMATSRVENR